MNVGVLQDTGSGSKTLSPSHCAFPHFRKCADPSDALLWELLAFCVLHEDTGVKASTRSPQADNMYLRVQIHVQQRFYYYCQLFLGRGSGRALPTWENNRTTRLMCDVFSSTDASTLRERAGVTIGVSWQSGTWHRQGVASVSSLTQGVDSVGAWPIQREHHSALLLYANASWECSAKLFRTHLVPKNVALWVVFQQIHVHAVESHSQSFLTGHESASTPFSVFIVSDTITQLHCT